MNTDLHESWKDAHNSETKRGTTDFFELAVWSFQCMNGGIEHVLASIDPNSDNESSQSDESDINFPALVESSLSRSRT